MIRGAYQQKIRSQASTGKLCNFHYEPHAYEAANGIKKEVYCECKGVGNSSVLLPVHEELQ